MIFLGKEPCDVDQFGRQCFGLEATRPLSLANTIPKLVASALRLVIERNVAYKILWVQTGYIRGRMTRSDIFDIDAAMRILGATGSAPLAILFDFKAAFPSACHCFLMHVLTSCGLPKPLLNIIKRLYYRCKHKIRFSSSLFLGPALLAGVRQGCPLSGILFAIVLDPFLRLLHNAIGPNEVLLAYADDMGLVLSAH